MFLIQRIRICCMINMPFLQCFMYYQTSWNIFSQCFLSFFFVFVKCLCSIYCTFPVIETLSMWISAWKEENNNWKCTSQNKLHFLDGIYSFKVNNGNTRMIREICLELTIKATERRTKFTKNAFMKDVYFFVMLYIHFSVLCYIYIFRIT